MTTREYAGVSVDVNDEGFLTDASQWTPEVGRELAKEEGIDALTDKHWQVLTFCREDAAQQGQPPGLRRISKLSGVTMKELYKLFPKGPGKLAARIAGLPKPQGCV
ncbi:MAG: TusE/DsrC/DsvC family sulfur relay protein [Acidobacteriota bacterium]|nr:TusE/DsrC/DsvC family sulfur relay protein [Acidobacteriota bacterium]